MSAARKKMREDLADKAEIHAFRGVSGCDSWLAGQIRPDVSCQVSQLQQTLPQPTVAQVCASSMVVRRVHQHLDLGLKIRRVPVRNMILSLHVDASLNTGGLVGLQGGYICGVTDQSAMDGKSAPRSPLAWRSFEMSRTVPSSLRAEAQAMSVALGFVEWAALFLQELIHGSFDWSGAPAVMQERPPVCVTDCESLYDHLLAVGSPTKLQDKRSAVDVLITRESSKKTDCVIRWAPTGLQLADGLTKDKEEAVEYMLRSEEQVMQERQLSRTSKKLEDKMTVFF